LEKLYQGYKDRAAFLFVYIREAHPDDGWQMDENKKEGVVFKKTKTLAERQEVAGKCCVGLKLSMPCVIDGLDNKVDEAYAAWPERIFIVDAQGKIAYAGAQGPWGFKPGEAEAWLKVNVGPTK